jgi:hypothetical protein
VRRRFLGRPERWWRTPTGQVVAVFAPAPAIPYGRTRIYDETEIADLVLQVADQVVNDPGALNESWYEFLRDVVGKDAMVAALRLASLDVDERAEAAWQELEARIGR